MPPHFGRRVVGDAIYEAEAAKAAVGAQHFGPRVVGPVASSAPAAPTTLQTSPGGSPGLSIAQLTAVLHENPAQFDALYAAERARADGPRKGALRVLLATEAEREGGGRPEVLEAIGALLESGQK